MIEPKQKVLLTRFVWIGLLSALWVSACTLLDDVPCKQDSDCPAYMGCYHGVQCLPARWIEQKRALDERKLLEPVAEPDANVEAPSEPTPEKPACVCALGQPPTPCFPEKLVGCNTDGSDCKGRCQPGTKRCIQLTPGQCPEWDKCENHTPPNATESCNGIDDNCDGNVDEGCLCQDGKKQPCYPHNTGCKQVGTSFTCTAPCEAGEQTCQDGKWGSCSGDKGPSAEICDNKDNNCDGMIDEIFPNQGNTCKTSEKGICEAGTTICVAGKEMCKATNTPTTEVCGDGKDNDCDGKTDEGCVSVFAGTGQQGKTDGPGNMATFNYPTWLAFDKVGNLYVTDSGNHLIRKIDTSGNVTTFAGTGTAGSKEGVANQAEFHSPAGIVFDAAGNLYVADVGNNKIRKVTAAGTVSTFSGSGTNGSKDGSASQAQFNGLKGLSIDLMSGTLYVAEEATNKIRSVDTFGNASTLAGTGSEGHGDGPSNQAMFFSPSSVLFSPIKSLYIADKGTSTVREVDVITGNVTTIAGIPIFPGIQDGPANWTFTVLV